MLSVMLVFVHYPKSVLTITHLCTSFVQMVAPALLVFDEDGRAHSECTLAPIGLFPVEQTNDPNWLSRVGHTGYLQQNRAAETISMSVKCMNALYRLQTLQAKAMAQITQIIGSAQTSHEMVNAKNEQIADLDAHIGQLEGQVEERDALLDERDADFALLEQQFTAQQIQLDNALDHIEVLEAQQAQPEAMEEEP